MIPKIKNCLDVASNGVKGVCIIDGRLNHSILFELLSNKGSGTLIEINERIKRNKILDI
jgi:acetylglutamate kinase